MTKRNCKKGVYPGGVCYKYCQQPFKDTIYIHIQDVCKVVKVVNLHEKQVYNHLKILLFKGDQIQLSMVEIAENATGHQLT